MLFFFFLIHFYETKTLCFDYYNTVLDVPLLYKYDTTITLAELCCLHVPSRLSTPPPPPPAVTPRYFCVDYWMTPCCTKYCYLYSLNYFVSASLPSHPSPPAVTPLYVLPYFVFAVPSSGDTIFAPTICDWRTSRGPPRPKRGLPSRPLPRLRWRRNFHSFP